MARKMRMGMVGGGPGAFIGAVHRAAASLDGQIELVCGAFSSKPEKSKQAGKELFLASERVYDNFKEMILKEKELPEGERMDFVSIVTPNFMHFEPAKLALENGFPVICDKPVTFTLEQALELKEIVDKTGLLFGITYTYSAYPMVKQAKNLVETGKLGKIKKVVVEYPQGYLAKRLENESHKQAAWRVDPKMAGISACMGDIGTHAENLAGYITGLHITEMCADLTSFVEGRDLDDDGNVLLRFNNGAKGILHASMISAGEENCLNIRVYGEKAGLEWHQVEPNTLIVKWYDKPAEIYRSGVNNGYLAEHTQFSSRLPSGHPEGYFEAFATIYRNFALTLGCRLNGEEPKPEYLDFPSIDEGIVGMKFVTNVVASSNSSEKWYKFE